MEVDACYYYYYNNTHYNSYLLPIFDRFVYDILLMLNIEAQIYDCYINEFILCWMLNKGLFYCYC